MGCPTAVGAELLAVKILRESVVDLVEYHSVPRVSLVLRPVAARTSFVTSREPVIVRDWRCGKNKSKTERPSFSYRIVAAAQAQQTAAV